jgi:hypothetical protein
LISDCDFLTIGATFTALRSYHFAVTCPWLVEGIAEPLRYVRFKCGLNRWQRRSVALQQPGIEYDRCAFDSTNSPCTRVKPLAKLVVATGFTPGWIAGWKCGRRGGRPSRAMCVATGFTPGIRRDGAKIAELEMPTTRRSSLPRYVRSDWLYARMDRGVEVRTTRRSSLPRCVRSDWLYARNPQGRWDDRGWKCGRRGGRPSRAMCVATGFMPGIRRDDGTIAGLEMRTTRRSSLPRCVRSDWLYARNPQGRCEDRGAGNADDAEVVLPALCG